MVKQYVKIIARSNFIADHALLEEITFFVNKFEQITKIFTASKQFWPLLKIWENFWILKPETLYTQMV